jgi:hypothetical protein
MFRKTYMAKLASARSDDFDRGTYIVSAEDSNDFAAAVKLDEQSLVEVLRMVSLALVGDRNRDEPSSVLVALEAC